MPYKADEPCRHKLPRVRYKVSNSSSAAAFARTLPAQKTETKVACSVLNQMTNLGMPVSQRIA